MAIILFKDTAVYTITVRSVCMVKTAAQPCIRIILQTMLPEARFVTTVRFKYIVCVCSKSRTVMLVRLSSFNYVLPRTWAFPRVRQRREIITEGIGGRSKGDNSK